MHESDEQGTPRRTDRANILVVDDHPDKLLVLRTILDELGENVVAVRSGSEALKQILDDEFAVVLLDVKMPEMDGFETAKLIRGRRKCAHVPIIFVTAYEDEMHLAEGYRLGAVDYILTPILPEVLRSKVSVFVQLFHLRNQIARQADERVALMREQAAREVAEAAIRRSAFLAEASQILSGSLDAVETARALTRFVVPHWADLCALVLLDEIGRIRGTEVAWAAADGEPDHASVGEIADPRIADGLARALAGTAPERFALATDATMLALAPDRTVTLAAPLHQVAIHPLVARGRRLGALVVGASSERTITTADRAVVADLAGRTAIALDNAALYSGIQDADRRKDEFLAMLAHELRNPLAPIRSALDVLRLAVPLEGIVGKSHGIIDRQVGQLIRLVDDLLDVSRLTQGKIRLERTVIELRQVIDGALETARASITERGHVLEVELPPTPIHVDGDPIRLAQVFANLINNAAKYTPAGGRIRVAAVVDGDAVRVSVQDDGAGIAPDVLPHIFDLFAQGSRSLARSDGGLGIGLTIVRSLLDQHGGSVEAHSAGPGHGSEFVVRLPAVAPPTVAAEGGTVPTLPIGLRILIIDDNEDASEALEELLRLDGQDVRRALDGPTALRVAREYNPQIVLCDLGLPGMDGFEVIRRLREQSGDAMPVMAAVTGYAHADDCRRTRDAGFDYHLAKPVAVETLHALLAAHGRSARGA